MSDAWKIMAFRGRGASSNRSSRYGPERVFDGEQIDITDRPPPVRTEVRRETTKAIISRNNSPDIGFDQSINPYQGCEHGCFYCYARPSHAWYGLSPGLDFETVLFAKERAAVVLRRELAAPKYKPRVIALGANTDPYQPIERKHRITRSILEVLAETQHPVAITTKSDLVVRDIGLLRDMAAQRLAKVAISITTLDSKLARAMEPRAPTPARRLSAVEALSEAGVPVTVMMAPIIPSVNDHEIETLLERARDSGVSAAHYVLLRLPLEIKDLARDWLGLHAPGRAKRVLSLVQSMHQGADYRSAWGGRQRGEGPLARLIANRFALAKRRLGLGTRDWSYDFDLFRPPSGEAGQLSLL